MVVARTEVPDLSRMTIVLHGQDATIEQARRQLEDVVPVWAVLNYTKVRAIERELLLVKVSVIPEDTLKEDEETLALAQDNMNNFVYSKNASMTPLLSSALTRQALTDLTKLFSGRVVDVALDSITIELSAKPSRIDAFIQLVKPFGIIEVARSGVMAMPRAELEEFDQNKSQLEENEVSGVDATMLPPG